MAEDVPGAQFFTQQGSGTVRATSPLGMGSHFKKRIVKLAVKGVRWLNLPQILSERNRQRAMASCGAGAALGRVFGVVLLGVVLGRRVAAAEQDDPGLR